MTEGEAKTKWCPNASSRRDKSSNCIASACMAWCWRRWERTEHGHTFEAYQHEPGAVPVDGFCGLARQA